MMLVLLIGMIILGGIVLLPAAAFLIVLAAHILHTGMPKGGHPS